MTSALASALSGSVASLLGFGGNLATSAINSGRAWKYTKYAMQYQDELNRSYTRDSYSLQKEGLKKAGYNPLLALGSGANSVIYSGSGSNADSDNGSQAVASAIDAMRLRNETKLNKSQLKLNDSQSDLNTQATYKTFADELKSRAEANVASATEAQIYNNINWDNLLNDARLKEIIANTKFQNERARGFSASSSKHYGAGAFSVKGDYSHSDSKSW